MPLCPPGPGCSLADGEGRGPWLRPWLAGGLLWLRPLLLRPQVTPTASTKGEGWGGGPPSCRPALPQPRVSGGHRSGTGRLRPPGHPLFPAKAFSLELQPQSEGPGAALACPSACTLFILVMEEDHLGGTSSTGCAPLGLSLPSLLGCGGRGASTRSSVP